MLRRPLKRNSSAESVVLIEPSSTGASIVGSLRTSPSISPAYPLPCRPNCSGSSPGLKLLSEPQAPPEA